MAKAKKRSLWNLIVTYPGRNESFDNKIEEIVERPISGSGYKLQEKVSDLEFSFWTKREASYYIKKAKALKQGVKVFVEESTDSW